ncbi:MAG: hypothetical protein ACO1OG_00010 [Devosia sp.]
MTMRAGMLSTAFAATVLLAGCGLSPEAKAVADACASIPRTTVESCECYAKELQSKLRPDLMRLATYAQTDPGKLLDPAIIGNVSANDVITVTQTSATALQTCKIV